MYSVRSSLFRFLFDGLCWASLIAAGNHFEVQFVGRARFGGVISGQCKLTKHGVKVRRRGSTSPSQRPGLFSDLLNHFFTESHQNVRLLKRRAIDEVLSKQRLAARIDIRKPG